MVRRNTAFLKKFRRSWEIRFLPTWNAKKNPQIDERDNDTSDTVSIEVVAESVKELAATSDTTSESVMIKIQVEEMIDALLNKDEVLFQMVSLLKEGYSKPEIKEMLGIPKSTFYDN